jgi:hypothetical protein
MPITVIDLAYRWTKFELKGHFGLAGIGLPTVTGGFSISLGHRRIGWITIGQKGIRETDDIPIPGLLLYSRATVGPVEETEPMKTQPCKKVRHATRRLAEKHPESVRKRNGERLHAYVCNYCGGWHVGHNYKAT